MLTDYWKVFVLDFLEMGNTIFFDPKSWWKDDIYWLLKSFSFELFGNGKYGLISAKKLMERWYWLGVFELSMKFQGLGSMVFVQCNLDHLNIISNEWTKLILDLKRHVREISENINDCLSAQKKYWKILNYSLNNVKISLMLQLLVNGEAVSIFFSKGRTFQQILCLSMFPC